MSDLWESKLFVAIVSAALGILGAIISDYYITSNKIDKQFEDWKSKLSIEKNEQERINRINQLKQLQESFLLSVNHLLKLKQIAHEYSYNEAIYYNRPRFAFFGQPLNKEDSILSSIEGNINGALQKREKLEAEMAKSDASFNGAFKSILQTHESECVEALDKVPEFFKVEVKEHDTYRAALHEYFSNEHTNWKTREDAFNSISSWPVYVKLMNWENLEGSFDRAMTVCHANLRVELKPIERN